jgi:hypothetical protein
MRPRPLLAAALALVALSPLTPGASRAAATLGFLETWNSGTVQGWGGGQGLVISNPGSGGLANSGYLRVQAPPPGQHFGTRSFGLEYAGSWNVAGISQVRVWLSDLGTDDALEVHLSVGNAGSLWQHDTGFVPPVDGWSEYVVDLSNPAEFTRVLAVGFGTFAGALDSVSVVHLRHDLAPFAQFPDTASGDFGIDGLLLTNGTVGVPPAPAALRRPVELAPPAPNPSRGGVTLAVTSAERADVTIRIVDATGRLVRRETLADVAVRRGRAAVRDRGLRPADGPPGSARGLPACAELPGGN